MCKKYRKYGIVATFQVSYLCIKLKVEKAAREKEVAFLFKNNKIQIA